MIVRDGGWSHSLLLCLEKFGRAVSITYETVLESAAFTNVLKRAT